MSLFSMSGDPNSYLSDIGGLQHGSIFGRDYGYDQSYFARLNKALDAKTVVDITTDTTGVGALQLHSMDSVVKNLAFDENRLTFWNMIPKSGARQIVEQYAQLLGFGQGSGFTSQAGMPLEADAEWGHAYEEVRFIRHVWKANDVVDMVDAIAGPVAMQKRAAAMRVLRDANIGLYIADNSANQYEFNGLYSTLNSLAPQNVFDMEDDLPTREAFDNMVGQLGDQEANVEGAYICGSTGGISTLAQVYGQDASNDFTRHIVPTQNGMPVVGYSFRTIDTMHGSLKVEKDIFISKAHERRGVPITRDPVNQRLFIEGSESSGAPGIPSATATAINQATYDAAVPGKPSKFTGTHNRPSGVKYKYRVSAGSATGGRSKASDPVEVDVVVIANGAVKIEITPYANGPRPEYYEVFSNRRSTDSTYYSIGRIKANASGTTIFYDANRVIPGTTVLYFLTGGMGEQATMSFRLLTPMYNKTLAPIGMFSWGVVNLYGMPLWFAPQKLGMMINVPVDRAVENNRLIA